MFGESVLIHVFNVVFFSIRTWGGLVKQRTCIGCRLQSADLASQKKENNDVLLMRIVQLLLPMTFTLKRGV